jgi:hypothetical protein
MLEVKRPAAASGESVETKARGLSRAAEQWIVDRLRWEAYLRRTVAPAATHRVAA